jgi:hypothetical protein
MRSLAARSTLKFLRRLPVRCSDTTKDAPDHSIVCYTFCGIVSGKPSRLKPISYVRTVPLILLCSVAGAAAQSYQAAREALPNPQRLVREVVETGLRQKNREQTHWSYREVVRKDGRLETREVCQTNTGTIDRLVAINDQPVSAEHQGREDARIQRLLADPSEIREERQKQLEDSAKQFRMFTTFPDAFRYEYAGREGALVKLAFEPNPQFVPGSRQ